MTPINTSITITNTAQAVLSNVKVKTGFITNDGAAKCYWKRSNLRDPLQPAVIGEGNVLNPGERIQLNNFDCNFSFICPSSTVLLISYS